MALVAALEAPEASRLLARTSPASASRAASAQEKFFAGAAAEGAAAGFVAGANSAGVGLYAALSSPAF